MKNNETIGVSNGKGLMMSFPISPQGVDDIGLPADLRKCLGEKLLLQMALDAGQFVDWSKADPGAASHPRFRPQMMLTLLSYCYAAGCYESRELELAVQNDPTMRYICAHSYPGWIEIRQFRRRHRPLVEQCLSRVLEKAWMVRTSQAEEGWTGGNRLGPELARKCAVAARDRIEVAIILDRVNSD
jgi:hypothetical protein